MRVIVILASNYRLWVSRESKVLQGLFQFIIPLRDTFIKNILEYDLLCSKILTR